MRGRFCLFVTLLAAQCIKKSYTRGVVREMKLVPGFEQQCGRHPRTRRIICLTPAPERVECCKGVTNIRLVYCAERHPAFQCITIDTLKAKKEEDVAQLLVERALRTDRHPALTGACFKKKLYLLPPELQGKTCASKLEAADDATSVVSKKSFGQAQSKLVVWGHTDYGGKPPCKITSLRLQYTHCGAAACVALSESGKAQSWGMPTYGGKEPDDVDLTQVVATGCGGRACWALRRDNTAEVWGDSDFGGAPPFYVELTNVADITCGGYTCMVLKRDGTATVWGHQDLGGRIPLKYQRPAADKWIEGVTSIDCGNEACVAINAHNEVMVWGHPQFGGAVDPSLLSGVVRVRCGGGACVALKRDNTALAWGSPDHGGVVPSRASLTNVVKIGCGGAACWALKADHTADIWGDPKRGGAPPRWVTSDLEHITCGGFACLVIKRSRKVEVWGDVEYGGRPPSDHPLNKVIRASCGGLVCTALTVSSLNSVCEKRK